MRDDRRLRLENRSTIDTTEIPIMAMEDAVAKQLEHFASAWGSVAWDLVRQLNRQRFRIVLRDYTSDKDAIAAHWRLGGHPTATVYVRDVLQLEQGSWIRPDGQSHTSVRSARGGLPRPLQGPPRQLRLRPESRGRKTTGQGKQAERSNPATPRTARTSRRCAHQASAAGPDGPHENTRAKRMMAKRPDKIVVTNRSAVALLQSAAIRRRPPITV
jgi:hypothetical protein